jgi:small conductance mechanosensitive channel
MQESVNKIGEYIMLYGLNVIVAVLIFFIGKFVARLVSNLVETIMDKTHIEKTLVSFLKNLTYFGLMAFVVIAALGKLGVETTSLIAMLGAAGLAVGLALQGSLANFAAGVLIIFFRPFKVGDFISGGGTMGTVDEIQIFCTILNAPDNRREIIPNSKLMGDNITNFSAVAQRRVDLVFGISYKDDIQTAKKVLENIVAADSRILKSPAPVIAVSALGDSSVNIVCRPWVKPADYWAVHFDTLEKGKIALENNGITIPFPQRDVHIYQEKA